MGLESFWIKNTLLSPLWKLMKIHDEKATTVQKYSLMFILKVLWALKSLFRKFVYHLSFFSRKSIKLFNSSNFRDIEKLARSMSFEKFKFLSIWNLWWNLFSRIFFHSFAARQNFQKVNFSRCLSELCTHVCVEHRKEYIIHHLLIYAEWLWKWSQFFFTFLFTKGTKNFVGRSRGSVHFLPKATNGLHATRQNVYEKKNKTDCVGFMLQNRDN